MDVTAEDKNVLPLRKKNPDLPASSIAAIPTEISRLQETRSFFLFNDTIPLIFLEAVRKPGETS
jgi:hypothetical protein